MRKKIEPLSVGITKTEFSYQLSMMELMNKLINEGRETNNLLKGMISGDLKNRPPEPNNRSSSSVRDYFRLPNGTAT
jgi:hypothetical protein